MALVQPTRRHPGRSLVGLAFDKARGRGTWRPEAAAAAGRGWRRRWPERKRSRRRLGRWQ
eukprot:scaffold95863_cov39-Phaeocystis_antarctica.AAC.1